MDEWVDECMDAWIDGKVVNECMDEKKKLFIHSSKY